VRVWICLRHFAVVSLIVAVSARVALANLIGAQPSFSQPVDYGAELTGAGYVVVGDVLNRGINDLVITHGQANNGHVSLLLGTGHGTFGAPQTIFSGTLTDQPMVAELADVNGDGNLDLVMLTTSSNSAAFLTVALGDGKGHFKKASQTPFSGGRFVIGKFGPDALPDVFVQTPYALPATVYRSNGRGGFTVVNLPYGGGAGGLVAADVNHDGLLDLVGIGQGPSLVHQEQLQTLFGTRDSRLFAPPRYTMPSLEESYSTGINSGITVAAGDLRGSGNTDLVISGADAQYGLTVVGSVYFGHPDGSYDPPLLLPIGRSLEGFGIKTTAAAIGLSAFALIPGLARVSSQRRWRRDIPGGGAAGLTGHPALPTRRRRRPQWGRPA
jgi:hypothetical protein